MIHIVKGLLPGSKEYFIFREDNTEVNIDVTGGHIKSNAILRPEERKYINEFILMKKSFESPQDEELEAIHNLAEQGMGDYEISKKLNLSFTHVVNTTTEFWRKRMSVNK